MKGLIAKLEAAPEGSRELSDECLLAAGWTLSQDVGPRRLYIPPDNSAPIYQSYAPDPTQSIDDARTLVPNGCYAGLDPIFFEEGTLVKYDAIICRANWEDWTPLGGDWIDRLEARAATPALALCIAALKAIEASK